MNLKAPFTGGLFDEMFREAVYTVAANITKAVPAGKQIAAQNLPTVQEIMTDYLAELQAGAVTRFSFLSDSSGVVARIATDAGEDRDTVETILREVETSTADGSIPYWFGEAGGVTKEYTASRDQMAALRPSLLLRVAQTIFKPISDAASAAGVSLPSLGTVVAVLEVLLLVAVIVGLAYAARTFRGKK